MGGAGESPDHHRGRPRRLSASASLLKAKNIPVLAGGIHRLPSRRFEAYDEPFVLPKKLYDAGIPFAIISDGDAAHERSLPYHAATAAAYGLPATRRSGH